MRSKATSKAQQRVNQNNSKIKLAMLIGGNFGPGDLLVTPTFSPEYLPTTYAEVQEKVRKFFDLLRTVRQKQGLETTYIYCPHHTETKRWHVHSLINAVGSNDWETIKSLWPWGDVHIKRFKDLETSTPDALAGYLVGTVENPKWSDRPNSSRAWCCSTNLKKTIVGTYWEHDAAVRLELPENCNLIEADSWTTPYGSFEYISYFRRGDVRGVGATQPDGRELIDRGLL